MANVVCPAGVDGRRRFGDTTGSLGGTLTYASGMADYAVRQLTSSYAPQIGGEKMVDVLTPEWVSAPRGDSTPAQAINAWCGGIGIGAKRRLFFDTGGHTDSACPAIWDYDFNDVNGRPVGFRLLPNSLSTLANTGAADGTNHPTYADGTPGAVHSYGGWFLIDEDTIARSCGALWHLGGSSNDTWKWDITTGARTQMADQLAGTSTGRYMFALRKPGQPYALMLQTSSAGYERLDVTTASGVGSWNGSWISAGGPGWGQYPAVVHDTLRDRVITFNTGAAGVQAFSVNWGAGTLSYVGTATMTGDTAIFNDSGLSAFYDESADKFWLFGGSQAGGAAGYSNVYEIDAGAFDSLGGVAVTAHALSSSLGVATGGRGSFGRFVWMPQDRLIGFVHHGDQAPSVIKLPEVA